MVDQNSKLVSFVLLHVVRTSLKMTKYIWKEMTNLDADSTRNDV